MKKFMTTKMSAVSTTPSPPLPIPATFSFDAVLQQTADRNGSATSPDTLERTKHEGKNSGMPSVPLSPPTPTAIPSVASMQEDKEVKIAKESSPGRVLAAANVTPSPSSSSSTGVVKMCGYLKKKRNKMGGWRKLFFILQNQLLLSYSSRDDYEKKLAPFKDIINLVPGTVIIPTTGPRFTIETNSKLMYTFRCDDHRSCSEWIMALLDSLTVANGGMSADRNFSLHNNFQRSTLPLSSFSLPSNCKPFAGVISRSNGPALAPKKRAPQPPNRPGPPKPPRSFSAEGTVRHRTGDEDDLNNNVLLQVQEGKLLASNNPPNTRDDGSKLSVTGGTDDTRGRTMLVDRRDRVKSAVEVGGVPPTGEEREREERNDRPRQQIFRLHQDVWSKSHHQSMDVCRINSMFNERTSVPTTIDSAHSTRITPNSDTVDESTTKTGCSTSSSGVVDDNGPSCNSHLYEKVGVPGTLDTALLEAEPIYAVVDVRAKRSRRLARTLDTSDGPADERAEGGRKVSVSLPQISDGVELITGTERRPVTARSCSNYDDYEDVNYLFETHRSTGGTETDSVGTGGSQEPLRHETYGDEHIYEPIQVSDRIPSITTGSSSSLPTPTDHHHSHSLWRQLKRMQLQGSWRRLTHRNGTASKPPSTEPPHVRSATVTALEGLGRRFDSHRRSIKKRIKNLCERIDPANGAAVGGGPLLQTPAPEPSAPETSSGVRSRKSVSLDSFLLAKGQSSVSRY
uniref:PH domain-containing protein n=1 Tax=Anopheles culicifacies TaxID=139723 RepID=A0A182LTV1_9DIPT